MKKIKQILLINIFLFGVLEFSEAQTLDYSTVGYPTSMCNVFNVSPLRVVGGLTHHPVSSGVSYNGSALVLQTKGGTSLATTLGTAYAIAFFIKPGFTYNVTVNASKTSLDAVSSPNLEIGAITSLPSASTTNPTACGALDQNKWSVLQTTMIGSTAINNQSLQNYPVVQNYRPSSNFSYFTVLAYGGSQTQSTTV